MNVKVQVEEQQPWRRILSIEVPADFPDKYRKALVRAASQCSVKKTIENPPEFQVETVVV